MPPSTNSEMAQCQPPCSNDNLLFTLIATASHRYTPTAPSPLNPRSSAETKHRQHAATHPRPSRSTRRKPAETPTEKLLRRKAAIAYQRSTQHSPSTPPHQDSDVTAAARPGDSPEKEPFVTFSVGEARPPTGSTTGDKPPSVGWRSLADMEAQPGTPLSGRRRVPESRQRLEILFMLVVLSACLMLLTIVGVDSLKGHYIAG